MKVLLFILFAGASILPARAAEKGDDSAKQSADKDTVELVDSFLKADTSKLPAGAIPVFMKIDYETLPERQRIPYQAKKAELQALRLKIDSKKKPPIRRVGQEPMTGCRPEKGSKPLVDNLLKMGFEQLEPDEVRHLEKKTKCSQCELVEEFGLKIIIVPPDKKKKQKHARRYFLMHASSPAMALVAAYRGGSKGGTNFFSVGFFGACR